MPSVHSLGRLEWQEFFHVFTDESFRRIDLFYLNNFLTPDRLAYKTLFYAAIDASQCCIQPPYLDTIK